MNRQVVLKSRPEGIAQERDFAIVETPLAELEPPKLTPLMPRSALAK